MLTFMVALHCEAKPLIDFYRLKKVDQRGFDLYRSKSVDVELVVTGIGALAMSAAVGWVASQDCPAQRVWLNIGTAGHADLPIGKLLLIHGVGDEVSQRCHYPPLVAKWSGITESLLSVNAPTSDYPGGAAVDMESYAFFNAALRFSDAELVQSVKVISDNKQSGIENLNAARLTELVTPHVSSIDEYAEKLQALCLGSTQEINLEDQLDMIDGSKMRGTHSQRLQVKELLHKLAVLDESQIDVMPQCDNLKELILVLRDKVDACVPSLKNTGTN